LLGDLDDDLLPLAEQFLDLRLRRPLARLAAIAAPAAALGVVLVLVAVELVELLHRVDDVGDVEEAVALEAEINERALHAGQHLRDPALVDVANHPAMPLALDEDLGDQILLENGDHRLVPVGRDDHFLLHSRSSMRARGPAPRPDTDRLVPPPG